MRRAALLLILVVALLPAAAAVAATPRTTLNDVSNEVMCVACGVPLNLAESPQADRERALIRRLIARGLTKQQVKNELVAQYGDRVIATPKDSGFGLTAYLVPIAIVLGALAALVAVVPRWRRRRADDASDTTVAPGTPELDADDARRLDADLSRYEV
jgi:cytochrome c-type biogenesis protein CcmH